MRWTHSANRRHVLIISAVLTTATLIPAATASATTLAQRQTASSGWVRFGHFAPTQEPVDVIVDGAVAVKGVGYKDVTDYLSLPAGTHRFAVRPSARPDAPNILEADAGVPADSAVTIAAVTTRDGLAVQVYDDQLTPPPPGAALVRFIHAAPDQPALDIAVANGPPLASALAYSAATPYQPIFSGGYDIQVRAAGTSNVTLSIAGWSIESGSQSTVIIIAGRDGNLDVVPVIDAAAVPVAPTGGVQTGFGGMAPQGATASSWLLLLVPGCLALATVGWAVRQRAITAGRATVDR
jgi:hypothetical protein